MAHELRGLLEDDEWMAIDWQGDVDAIDITHQEIVRWIDKLRKEQK